MLLILFVRSNLLHISNIKIPYLVIWWGNYLDHGQELFWATLICSDALCLLGIIVGKLAAEFSLIYENLILTRRTFDRVLFFDSKSFVGRLLKTKLVLERFAKLEGVGLLWEAWRSCSISCCWESRKASLVLQGLWWKHLRQLKFKSVILIGYRK